MVRPEDVTIGPAAPGGIALKGSLISRTYLGSRVHFECQTAMGTRIMVETRPGNVPDAQGDVAFSITSDAVALLSSNQQTA